MLGRAPCPVLRRARGALGALPQAGRPPGQGLRSCHAGPGSDDPSLPSDPRPRPSPASPLLLPSHRLAPSNAAGAGWPRSSSPFPAATLGKGQQLPDRPAQTLQSQLQERPEMGSAAHSTPGWARQDTLCSWKDVCGDAACPLLRWGIWEGPGCPWEPPPSPKPLEFCSPGLCQEPSSWSPDCNAGARRLPLGPPSLRGPPLWACSLWWKLPEPRGPAGWDPALSSG